MEYIGFKLILWPGTAGFLGAIGVGFLQSLGANFPVLRSERSIGLLAAAGVALICFSPFLASVFF